MLDKKETLFERDEKGELLPKTVKVEILNVEIRMRPLLETEWNEIIDSKPASQDGAIILKCCLDPEYTPEEVRVMKTVYLRAIAATILDNSGFKFETKESDPTKN